MAAGRPWILTLIALAALGVAAAIALGPAQGDLEPMTLYVDRDSSAGACNDGRAAVEVSAGAPWCSLETAMEEAPSGSTLLVRGGRYPRLTVEDRGDRGPITLAGAGSPRPAIAGLTLAGETPIRVRGFRITDITELDGASQAQFVDNDISPHGITGSGRGLLIADNDFHDLTIARDRGYTGPRCNPYSANAGVPPRCGFALRLVNSSDVTIRGNSFRRIPVDGLQGLEMRNLLVEGNLFEDISAFVDRSEHSDSIQLLGDSDRVTIRRNFFHRARGVLAQPFEGHGAQRRMVIENNVLVRLRHWGLNLFDAPGVRVIGNTIWDTGGRGLGLTDYPGDPASMTGAVVVNNVVSSIRAAPTTMVGEDHNLVDEGTRTGAHDLSVPRPRFVNERRSDYRLARGNPAIDAGLGTLASRTDIRGARRVTVSRGRRSARRARADIGAYEFAGRGARRSRFPRIARIGPAPVGP